jgi:hypothetical protein
LNGPDLRALRVDAGLTLAVLARLIGRDKGHLSRVERAQRPAGRDLVSAYQGACRPATLDDVRRRDLFAAAAIPAAVALTGAVGPPQRVGPPEVAAIRSLALDLDLSHPLTIHVAQNALQRAVLMLKARVSPAVKYELPEVVSLLADRIGWGLLETGQDPANTLAFAHNLAQQGRDPDLRAHTLLDLAVASTDPRLAVTTLEHALAERTSSAERVNLHAVVARIAARHDLRTARRHLAQAMSIEPEPGQGVWTTQSQITVSTAAGHLDALVGFAAFATGHAAAYELLTSAVDRLGPLRRRTRARCHVRLAGLAMREHENELTLSHLEATQQARKSSMLVRDLRSFAADARAAGRVELERAARTIIQG